MISLYLGFFFFFLNIDKLGFLLVHGFDLPGAHSL
jgi:hypothetical protein